MKIKIQEELFLRKDPDYLVFQSKLIPNIEKEKMIGIRTPVLRDFASKIADNEVIDGFLNDLPHYYFDENQLHAFIISKIKDFDRCIIEVDRFLPFIDNWATCDQLSPKVFKKNREKLLDYIKIWIKSDRVYTVRFAVGMLMQHFLDDDFDSLYPKMVAEVRSEDYYVKMMVAWYFATALAKQYNSVIPFIENKELDAWLHNKAIQKSIESYRISPEQKEYLKSLKVKSETKR